MYETLFLFVTPEGEMVYLRIEFDYFPAIDGMPERVVVNHAMYDNEDHWPRLRESSWKREIIQACEHYMEATKHEPVSA